MFFCTSINTFTCRMWILLPPVGAVQSVVHSQPVWVSITNWAMACLWGVCMFQSPSYLKHLERALAFLLLASHLYVWTCGQRQRINSSCSKAVTAWEIKWEAMRGKASPAKTLPSQAWQDRAGELITSAHTRASANWNITSHRQTLFGLGVSRRDRAAQMAIHFAALTLSFYSCRAQVV